MKKYILLFLIVCSCKAYSTVIWGSSWAIPQPYGCDDGNQYVDVGFFTNGEINNDQFQIMRSTDPNFGSSIYVNGPINGCGTCGERSYNTIDYGPFTPNTTYYYQVKATSNSVNFSYSSLGTYISSIPTVVNWISQVTSSVQISSTPNTENSYSWGIETRNIQGVTISLSPTEISKIYVEENNYKLNFILDFALTMVSIEVNIDNSGYFSLYNGSPVTNYNWSDASSYITNIGEHQLLVKFTDAVSGTIYYRQYKIFIVPKSDELYKDNYCNTMRVWKNTGNTEGIPLLLSEGFDAYNTKPEQYYREAGKDLTECMLTKGFDVYVINYKYNSQDVRNNAAIFSSAIRYISSINNNNLVIAAGISMGGIINRYACAKAEDNGNPLPISKFLTLDAPHQGADISNTLQDWRKDKTQGDVFAEHASNNDAAKELLNYCAYDPTATYSYNVSNGVIHNNFYNELNSLNGDGYPHLIPTIGVSFSTSSPNPNSGGQWLSVSVSGVPGNYNENFYLTGEEIAAGSFLPNINIDPIAATDSRFFFQSLLSILRPFSDPSVTLSQNLNPTFISHKSSLDIVNGVSKFDITIQPSTTSFHDIIPQDIIEPIVNALINENLFLQDKTITDSKNYIARNKIEAGNNVTSTLPVGDFILDNGSDVTMTAGNQIILWPGFIAESGSNFVAQIGIAHCDGTLASQTRTLFGTNTSNDENTNIYQDEVEQNITSNKVLNENAKSGIIAFPNPNNGKFQIISNKTSIVTSIQKITIFDTRGNNILELQNKANTSNIIDISSHSKGLYFIKIEDEQGIKIEKIIYQ